MQCYELVYSRKYSLHRCTRKGVVQHEGRYYCKQHSPQAKAEREAERRKAYAEKSAMRNRANQRQVARQEAMALIIELNPYRGRLPEDLAERVKQIVAKYSDASP
jgi:hypothetical protein